MSTLTVGDTFTSMKEAKLSIKASLKDEGQSYLTVKSEPVLFVLKCKTTTDQVQGEILSCNFWVTILLYI
jgi:hypothetical protein